jgi:hypothetical protein
LILTSVSIKYSRIKRSVFKATGPVEFFGEVENRLGAAARLAGSGPDVAVDHTALTPGP